MTKHITPWRTINSTKALDEKWFPVRRDRVVLPSGRIVDDYFVWESPHIVTVIAVTEDDKFVLVRQYRHAIAKIIHQFPAGAVDQGELPEAAAKRELLEEAGYACDNVVHIGTMSPFGTKMTGLDDFYIALDAKKITEPRDDDMEESEVLLKTRDELLAMFTTNDLQMANLICGVFLALRYLDAR